MRLTSERRGGSLHELVRPVEQMQLDLRAPCDHEHSYPTTAYVPAGWCCGKCHQLLGQFIPKPPELLGYVSGDWQWRLDGKAWTTQWPNAPRSATEGRP